MVAGGQRVARRAAARKRPQRGPGPARWLGRRARAPAVQSSLPEEPLGPQAQLNEWGRKAGAGPSQRSAPPPRPRLPGGSGSRTRAGLPVSHWLLRPPVKAGPGGLGPEQPLGDSPGHTTGAPPFSLPGPRPGDGERRGLCPSPQAPCCGQMWADVEAGPWRGGRAPRGEEIPPLPRAQGPSAGGCIWAAKQSSLSPPPPRSAPARVKRRRTRLAGRIPACGLKSRGAQGEHASPMAPARGHQLPPTEGTPAANTPTTTTTPGATAAPSWVGPGEGTVREKGHRAGMEHGCQRSQGQAPPPSTIRAS